MTFEVMSRKCDQCLLSPERVVSAARASQLLRDCARKDVSFECHKGTLAGRHIACRGHFDTGVGQMSRIAERLGMIVEIDPDTLASVDTDRMAETALAGSGRSLGSAVGSEADETPTPSEEQPQ